MKSKVTGSGETGLPTQYNSVHDDARGSSFMLAHQQLGALALGTTPTNGQTVTVIVNGTSIVFTAVTGSPTNPGDVKAPGTALGFVTNLIAAFRRSDLSTATYVPISSANQALIQYVGWAWPGASTTIVPFSFNKNVNGGSSPLTSFNITTTVTSGSWTVHTMQLYIEDGTYYIGTTRVLFTGGSTPTFTAPSTHPRIDLITADSSGTIALVTGTESVTPSAPSYPANKIVIAEVTHVVGETALYDNENQQAGEGYILNDVRPMVNPAYISALAQVAAGLFLVDPGGEAQGAIPFQGSAALQFLAPGSAGFVLSSQGASANPQWVAPNTKVSFDSFADTTVSIPTGNVETQVAFGTVIAMAANSNLHVRGLLTPGSTPSGVMALQLNGTDLFTIPTASNASAYFDVVISNRNSTSAQVYSGTYVINGVQTFISGTGAIALGSNFTLAVTAKQNSGSSQNFTVNQLFVLPING